MPRLRSQRLLVLAGLLVLATFLHTLLCEWRFENGTRSPRRPIIGRTTEVTPTAPPGGQRRARQIWDVAGLYAQVADHWGIAVIFGTAVPLFLVGTDVFLFLGWRARLRAQRGICPMCKYDLRAQTGEPVTTCPECGCEPARFAT